ncbi:MAG: DNA-processing protein DprA [Actinomycetales bacterium]|nr:DNA-processing protein DprA [Actinomycetales bacterium]
MSEDDDRLARLVLSHIVEPGDVLASVLVSSIGAPALLDLLIADRPLPFRPALPPSLPPALPPPLPPVRGGGVTSTSEQLASRWDRWRVKAAAAPSGVHLLTDLADRGHAVVIPGDAAWPVSLAERRPGLLDANGDTAGCAMPLALYCAGDPARLSGPMIAIVGRRAASGYGVSVARDLAADLVAAGWAVVSGAAYGIDAAAHAGALAVDDAGTLAVMAGGVDQPYPRGHEALLARIRSGAVVCGEYPPLAHPTRSRFLARNRLIAALAVGTVVVQAEYRSGALNTARWARDCGRVLMGVPGPVTDAGSAGVHRLIAEGAAQLVTSAAEVIECCSPIGEGLAPPPPATHRPHDDLTDVEQRVHEALHRREGASLAQIAAVTGESTRGVLAALGRLELAGLACVAGDGWRAGTAPAPP